MAALTLNIVAFDIPFPANYGGTIDIFYKLKTLNKLGVDIILHCFKYNKEEQDELKKYCKTIHYYPRKKGFLNFLSGLPYIVLSRSNKELLDNLLDNTHPILFEGLHSCFFLNAPELSERVKIVRTHNVEHDYYKGLANASNDLAKKSYYQAESRKLLHFESTLNNASAIVAISPNDQAYFSDHYKNVHFLPAFHPFEIQKSKPGTGDYFLYHGNLSVEENKIAADFLVDEVFSKSAKKLVIAGKNPDKRLAAKIKKHTNIKLVANPKEKQMNSLLVNAQACVLPTFQATGLKLKLLISLFSSRFVIANNLMIDNTGMESLCERANSAEEFIAQIDKIASYEFSSEKMEQRSEKLQAFSNQKNGNQLILLIRSLL